MERALLRAEGLKFKAEIRQQGRGFLGRQQWILSLPVSESGEVL